MYLLYDWTLFLFSKPNLSLSSYPLTLLLLFLDPHFTSSHLTVTPSFPYLSSFSQHTSPYTLLLPLSFPFIFFSIIPQLHTPSPPPPPSLTYTPRRTADEEEVLHASGGQQANHHSRLLLHGLDAGGCVALDGGRCTGELTQAENGAFCLQL